MSYRGLLLRIVFVCAAVACLLVVAIRVQQYAFRFRAERLVADVQRLHYGRTTFAGAQQILERWDPHYDHAETWCRKSECRADVATGDIVANHLWFLENHRGLIRIYRLLGGRPAEATASVKIRNDRVGDLSYGLLIDVPPGETGPWAGCEYDLIGEVGVSNTDLYGRSLDDPQHPTYRVGWPSGCEICVAINISFRPDASQSDIQRLGRFDFSCLSRWLNPCREKSDILPEALAQARRDEQLSSVH